MSPFFVSRFRPMATPTVIAKRFFHFSPVVVLTVAFAGLCLFYVWQMTAMSMRSYAYNDLERQRVVLAEDVARLNFASLEYQSLARVEERLSELHLVRDTAVDRVTREELRLSLSVR